MILPVPAQVRHAWPPRLPLPWSSLLTKEVHVRRARGIVRQAPDYSPTLACMMPPSAKIVADVM
jgi:hypothetical protein